MSYPYHAIQVNELQAQITALEHENYQTTEEWGNMVEKIIDYQDRVEVYEEMWWRLAFEFVLAQENGTAIGRNDLFIPMQICSDAFAALEAKWQPVNFKGQ